MAQNDVHRFSCVGSHTGSELAVITLHARETSGIAEVATMAGIIKTDILTPLATYQHSSFRWDIIHVITDNTTPPRSEEYTTGFPITGSSSGTDELPHQLALVVTLKTAYAGRSYRGRVYLPCFSELQTSGGLWTSTIVTGVQGMFDTYLGHVGASGTDTNWRAVVWSEKLQSANNIVQAVARNNPGVIRRRRIGVGQ